MKQEFLIGKTEITNAKFKLFVNATNYTKTAEKDFTMQIEKESAMVESLIESGSLVFKNY